jgi:hypothetical protein
VQLNARYLAGVDGRLSFPLFDTVRSEMRGLRDGNLEAIRRDEQEWKGRVLASGMLHDLQGERSACLGVGHNTHAQFWNVRLASKHFNTPANSAVSSAVSLLDMTSSTGLSSTVSSTSSATSPGIDAELTPEELKKKQDAMELKVQQIWHVLSGYEESSAALIGDMLRAVNNRQLLEIILLAERFILYVEVLFAVIDDLEAQFALAGAKGELMISFNIDTRHVTRTRGKAFMSSPRQPAFGHVPNLAQYARSIHPHHAAGALPQNPDPSSLDRRNKTRA